MPPPDIKAYKLVGTLESGGCLIKQSVNSCSVIMKFAVASLRCRVVGPARAGAPSTRRHARVRRRLSGHLRPRLWLLRLYGPGGAIGRLYRRRKLLRPAPAPRYWDDSPGYRHGRPQAAGRAGRPPGDTRAWRQSGRPATGNRRAVGRRKPRRAAAGTTGGRWRRRQSWRARRTAGGWRTAATGCGRRTGSEPSDGAAAFQTKVTADAVPNAGLAGSPRAVGGYFLRYRLSRASADSVKQCVVE